MELQLGLALPTTSVFGFDLNTSGLQSCFSKTCSSTSSQDSSSSTGSKDKYSDNKPRFSTAFDDLTAKNDHNMPETLPLLHWNNHPNDEDDDPNPNKDSQLNNFAFAFSKIEEDSDDGIVGWPPIKYRRKKIRVMENNRRVDNADCYGRQSNYVKVKMEGVAIARKIDSSLFDSFQSLKDALLAMFGICRENSNRYKLTYQDREGDWLLADDISYRSFIRSVQRLKLIRTNNVSF